MNYRIDLHTHTNISDGASTPKKLIEDAVLENIKAIALTDHDNIAGIRDAAKYAKENNIDFLNGIEISSLYKDGRMLHILGIGIDIENESFLNAFYNMKKEREDRIKHILMEISKKGINISIDELRGNSLSEYLDRYDVYRYFIKNNICKSPQEIWDKFLDPIPYNEGELLSVEESINMIKKAGGVSFLAHYNKSIGFAGLNTDEIEKEVKNLINLGLDGIEKYYPSFTEQDCIFLDNIINKYNLMYSGGTDYHGENRPDIKIGSGKNNNLFIPYSIYKNIIQTINMSKGDNH
ncbi:error-prone DNA polymerase [Clostridium puniceum]|uniref:Error-prone DNA polymerase n=1 Tax=Clostridium puniceum TaxID=29367 RepID=A0A1S8T8V1_9CLOT|nr:PHP domain-containing protein [Clostridium puniceum]OOM74031.1 error-prone DNA polymerase [Clostridium puniceum]